MWYFKIVSNFTCLTAGETTYNNFEISLVVFIPNITTNHAITYTNGMLIADTKKLFLNEWQDCYSVIVGTKTGN